MKTTLILLGLMAFFALASAVPFPREETHEIENTAAIWEPAEGELTDEHVERVKRATCDLTNFSVPWFQINDSACAAHCLVKGYKGGRCRDTICHCRN